MHVRKHIQSLPKAELHLHLEGTVAPETLVELSRRHDAEPLALEQARALYRYHDFAGFLMAFKAVTQRLLAAEDFELIAYRLCEQLAAQNVPYAEVFVSVGVVLWRGQAFEPLFEGMERGRVRGERDWGVRLAWIFDAVRHFGVEAAEPVFALAARLRRSHPSVVAIGIGGDERRGPAEPFRDLYRQARDAGLHLTAHAGENAGPESIWAALNIGAERIGHGLHAFVDNELMHVLAERQVPVEICISSNARTGCLPRLEDHPVRRYFDEGLFITLNSDDPAMFHTTLGREYELAHRVFEFTPEQLRELARNSFEASFLPVEDKLRYYALFDGDL